MQEKDVSCSVEVQGWAFERFVLRAAGEYFVKENSRHGLVCLCNTVCLACT